MKIDDQTGEVRARLVLEKNKITRRHRVKEKKVERSDRIDSRFDTRRSPLKWKQLHPRNIGVVYLYGLIWVVFTLWIPETWLTWLTHRSVLNQIAILVAVTIGLLVPLAAGVFDLSIAATISASSVTVAWALVEAQWSVPVSIAAALAVGLVVGAFNGFLVVKIHIDSFIATLGTSSVLTAYAVWRSNNRSILGFPDSFKDLTTELAWGINKTVLYALVLAFVVWFVFEHTALGRYLFATGGAREAARLAGVQTDRYVFGSLVTSAMFAALGGVLLASQFGSTQAQSGAPYLLPAFAAAFLGSTQFKRRFNVWGAVLAVFVLQSGVKGLQLAGIGSTWIESLFFGIALIVAVGFSSYRKRVHGQNAEEWWFDPADREGHHLKP
ncbi:MAG: ABC transporter permease [Ilumatobacteraceae bacterium]|nr:ABC transporter permease [Ilumatobacteraceae bacterium]